MLAQALTVLPNVQFRKNPRFYILYDTVHLAFSLSCLALMYAVGHGGLIQTWRWEYLALFPLVLQAQILASVFVHVCTHKSFPRWCNRLIGEICGLVILTRFASWEIVHQRHHQYSDDVEKDPHPVMASYWRYFFFTIKNVEHQLQQAYLETYGDTPENRKYEKVRAYYSYITNLTLVAAWYFFLGPIAFFVFFVPVSILGALHLVHFNWSTHNGMAGKDFRPVNLDQGYFWLGNKLWFGIYMHANHHKRPQALNPAKIEVGLNVVPRAEWRQAA